VPAELLNAIGRLDAALFQWLRTYHSPFLDTVMAGLSDVARGGAIWIFLAVLIAIFYPARRPAAVHVWLAVWLTLLVTEHAAKPFFNRARPFEAHVETRIYGVKPISRSLPSGHAAMSIAGAHAASRLAPEGRAIFWLLAFLVASSRVYLGVHYPADVIVGGILGFAIAKFVTGGTRWKHLI
jgi:undecaprenyl-diphosphatase